MTKFGYNNISIQTNTGIDSDKIVAKVWAIYVFYNMYDDAYYVGQTIDFANRKKSHFNALKKGTHPNKPLQSNYDKIKDLGLDPTKYIKINMIEYKFYLIDFSEESLKQLKEVLIEKEEKVCTELLNKKKKLYNLFYYKKDKQGNLLFISESYKFFSKETRDKLSKAQKQRHQANQALKPKKTKSYNPNLPWGESHYLYGKKLPKEILEASKWSNAKPVVIKNVYYYSAKEAVKCLVPRESYAKILRRIKKPNNDYYWFSDYMEF